MAPKKIKTPKKEEAKDEEMPDASSPKAESPKKETPKKEEPGSPKKEEPGSPKKEGEEPKEEEKKEPEKPKKVFDVEWAEDVPKDTRKKTAGGTEINKEDASLTLLIADGCLSSASRDGLGNLYSGGRATAGVKAGRYLFEVRVLDVGMLRIGFGTQEGSLVGGSDASSVAVDEAGRIWTSNKFSNTKPGASQRVAPGDVFGALINVDAKSEQKNTLSFFRNGQRVAAPFALPEELHGKTLFPMVAIKQAIVSVHFGGPDARPLKELPFQARTLDDAANADVAPTTAVAPKDGKREVVFPVGLPDEGTGDFLDFAFYPNAKKKYLEVSERGLAKLLVDSGARGQITHAATFRIEELTNGRMLNAYIALAAAKKRDYVVVRSVRGALIRKDREDAVLQFTASWFVKKAVVAVGSPPASFAKLVRADQIEQLTTVKRNQVNVEKAKWTQTQEQAKKVAEAKANAANLKAKAVFEKAKKDFEKKKAEYDAAKEKAEEGKDLPEEPTEPEEPADVAAEYTPEDEPNWDEKAKIDEAAVTCTFRPRAKANAPLKAGEVPQDIPQEQLAQLFGRFELPTEGAAVRADNRWLLEGAEAVEQKGEGFDAVEYVWAKKAEATKYLSERKSARKISDKWAGLQIGPYHKEQLEAWSTKKFELRKKHTEFVEREKKRKAAKLAKEKGEEAPASPKSPKSPKKEEEKKEGEETKEGEEKKEEKKEEEKKDEDVEMDLDWEPTDADVWGATDVVDTDGKGTPMFKDFGTEDWILAQARFEVHHVVKCFASDATAKDPERRGITTELFAHYYALYFSKPFSPQSVGQKDLETFLTYFADMVEVKDGVLAAKSEDDVPLDRLVRATEEARRDRTNRIAAGDESAKLTFSTPKPHALSHVQKGAQKGYQAQPKGYGKAAAKPGAVTPYGGGKGAYQQPRYGQPYGKGYQQPQAYGGAGYKRPAYQQQPAYGQAKRPAYGR